MPWSSQRWRRDSNKMAFTKLGTVHFINRIVTCFMRIQLRIQAA